LYNIVHTADILDVFVPQSIRHIAADVCERCIGYSEMLCD